MIKIDKELFIYTVGRVSSLAVKPIILFWIITYGSDEESKLVALIFTLSISMSYFMAIEGHKIFYRFKFAKDSHAEITLGLYRSYIDYIMKVLRISIFGSCVAFFVFGYLSNSFIFAILFSICVMLDWFISEYIRYLIFDKRLSKSVIVVLFRYGLPAIVIMIMLPRFSDIGVVAYLVSSIFVCVLIIGFFLEESKIIRIVSKGLLSISDLSPKKIILDFWVRKEYIIAAFGSRHVIIIDRYIIFIINEQLFAIYTLLANFLNILPLFMDMFYLAKRRAIFIRKMMPISEISNDSTFIKTLIIGCLVSTLSCLVILLLQKNILENVFIYGLFLVSSYTVYSYGLPFMELVFWHRDKRERVIIELGFLVSICIVGIVIQILQINMVIFFSLLLILHIVRTIVYVRRTQTNLISV